MTSRQRHVYIDMSLKPYHETAPKRQAVSSVFKNSSRPFPVLDTVAHRHGPGRSHSLLHSSAGVGAGAVGPIG